MIEKIFEKFWEFHKSPRKLWKTLEKIFSDFSMYFYYKNNCNLKNVTKNFKLFSKNNAENIVSFKKIHLNSGKR